MTTLLDLNPENSNYIPSVTPDPDLDLLIDIPVKRVLLGAKKALFGGTSIVVIGIDAAGELVVSGSSKNAADVLALIEKGRDFLQNALAQ